MLKEIFVDVHMGLFVLVQIMHLVSGGDDGPWDYSSFGRWVPPQRPIMHFAGDSGSGTVNNAIVQSSVLQASQLEN